MKWEVGVVNHLKRNSTHRALYKEWQRHLRSAASERECSRPGSGGAERCLLPGVETGTFVQNHPHSLKSGLWERVPVVSTHTLHRCWACTGTHAHADCVPCAGAAHAAPGGWENPPLLVFSPYYLACSLEAWFSLHSHEFHTAVTLVIYTVATVIVKNGVRWCSGLGETVSPDKRGSLKSVVLCLSPFETLGY